MIVRVYECQCDLETHLIKEPYCKGFNMDMVYGGMNMDLRVFHICIDM